MFALPFLFALLSAPGAAAEVSRCESLRAAATELSAQSPLACNEARDTHAAYLRAIPELLETCRKLEAQVLAGEPKLDLDTESKMQIQVMEAKQRHTIERGDLSDHVLRDLLPTPLDTGDPTRLPLQVGSECGTEIEDHVRFRREVLDSFTGFYGKIDAFDDALLRQAAERALPTPVTAPQKNVR
jgi:hypothetical protein